MVMKPQMEWWMVEVSEDISSGPLFFIFLHFPMFFVFCFMDTEVGLDMT